MSDEVLNSVRRGLSGTGPSATMLVGSAGLGKTALLTTLAGHLDARYRLVRVDRSCTHTPYSVANRLFTERPDPTVTGLELIPEGVELLCATGPIVLLVDDAHLADRESLSLLHRLALAANEHPIALVLTRRRVPHRASLTMLEASSQCTRLELRPLTPEGLDALAAAHLGHPPDAALRARLHATGGNPARAVRLLESLTGPPTGAATAETLDAGLRAQLGRIDARILELVRLVAAFGEPVPATELAALHGRVGSGYTAAVVAAVESGLLHWTHDGRLDCADADHRRVAYDATPQGLRMLLHDSIARTLSAAGAEPTSIHRHRRLAREVAGVAPTLHPAAVQNTGALDPTELLAGADVRPDLTLAARLAEAGRMGEATRAAEEVLASDPDTVSRTTALLILLGAHVVTAEVTGCRLAIDRLLAAPLPPETLDWLRMFRDWLPIVSGHARVEPGQVCTPARDGASGFGLDSITPGLVATLTGDCVGGFAHFEQGLQEQDSCLEWYAAGARAWPMWAALHAHGPLAALACATVEPIRGDSLARTWLQPIYHGVHAQILYHLGRFDDATAASEEALTVAEHTESGWSSLAVAIRGRIELHRGDPDAAARRVSAWQRTGRPELFGCPDTTLLFAEIECARANMERSAEHAAAAWETSIGTGRISWALRAAPTIARIASQAGDRDLFGSVLARVQGAPTDRCPALAPGVLLTEAMAKQDPDTAAEAARACARLGDTLGELAALEAAAVAAAETKNPAGAREFGALAQNLAVRLGARTDQRRVESRLRAHGVVLGVIGPRCRTADGWGSLTPTEQRVATLIGGGLTGPQIAARLGISPRTVQTHVSHALAKLGLGSRVALAARVRALTDRGPTAG